MSNPSIVSYQISSGNSDVAYIPLPTGVSSGNYIFGILRSDSSGVHNIPSGFTQLGQEFTIFNYIDTFNAGACFYKIADGTESTGNYINIESGKYISYVANVVSTGIKEYRQFNNNLDMNSSYAFGCYIKSSGKLVINAIGGICPFTNGTYISQYDAPFNGLFHSGVSLYINSGIYNSGYSPIWSVIRPTGYPFENSGYLSQFPPALFSFGLSVAFN